MNYHSSSTIVLKKDSEENGTCSEHGNKEVEMNFYEERLKKLSIFVFEKIRGNVSVLKG